MNLTLALVFVLLSSPVFAQTVEGTLDLSALGWGALDAPESIETDGDFATREWLIRSLDTNRLRVAAERPSGLCAGPWFSPRAHPFAQVWTERIGLVHKLLVRSSIGANVVTVIALDTPTCERLTAGASR